MRSRRRTWSGLLDGCVVLAVVSAQFGITSELCIDMRATTDHPGLLVTLTPSIAWASR